MYAPAQYNLGIMYENGEGIVRSNVQVYKWFILAKAQLMNRNQEVHELLSKLENKMTKNQIAKAQKLASQFKIQK